MRRVTALASIPNSRANSAASRHFPLHSMKRMLLWVPVMPSSQVVRWFIMLAIAERTRENSDPTLSLTSRALSSMVGEGEFVMI